ncbi:MAG: 4Fe-4S binding protein [Oscillospiraceae bacterium]|nr:4Fe-4S binding protein [Oscillospiraceae bacterium]
MKRIFVNEDWCLGCHLCEYHCANANLGGVTARDMVRNLKGKDIVPRIQVEDGDNGIHFAVSCRHCYEPQCVRACITGALTQEDGVIRFNTGKCVGCYTCVLNCPYGAIMPADPNEGHGHVVQKCELCLSNNVKDPACVAHCPNKAIVLEERD